MENMEKFNEANRKFIFEYLTGFHAYSEDIFTWNILILVSKSARHVGISEIWARVVLQISFTNIY